MDPAKLVSDYFREPKNKAKLDHLCQRAVELTQADTSLRAPRSLEERHDAFSVWLERYRDRLADRLEDEFATEFPLITSSLRNPDLIRQVVLDHVWPEVVPVLLAYAIRSQAASWSRRLLGEAVLLGWPNPDGPVWRVPLRLRGSEAEAGEIVLNQDGDVIPHRSTTREQLEEWIGAHPRPRVKAAPK